jgi:hypothetical protein
MGEISNGKKKTRKKIYNYKTLFDDSLPQAKSKKKCHTETYSSNFTGKKAKDS